MATRPFIGCDARKERANVAFYYPSNYLRRDPDEVANALQAAFDLLAETYPAPAGIDYGKVFSDTCKLIIGYRRGRQHKGDGLPIDPEPEDKDLVAGYFHPEHRINIPWDRLFHSETSHGFLVPLEFQPEYCLGHELGHPFESVCLAGNQNQEEWKEGLCDFTRLLLLQLWCTRKLTFEPIRGQYEHYILTLDPTEKDDGSVERRYHYAAQLLLNSTARL